ncbi:MAG: hypothetical protein HKP61_20845 [Dactylosporangium sp.]|nr:hypothetical protein [Dactylosporangium sp.]
MVPKSSDSSVRDRLLSWDAGWFIRVARDGYPRGYTYGDHGEVTANELAFFPGFPLMIRAVHAVTGGSFETAALITGSVAGCAATLAVYALGRQLYDHRTGVIFATLFCTQPMSVVLSMGYSEGLFVALAAATFVLAKRGAWEVAGIFGLGAALSRPTGAAVALGLAVAALLRVRSATGRSRWRPLAGALLALAGMPAYLLWVGIRAGAPQAWFDIQTAGWGTTFDVGDSARRFIFDALRTSDGFVAISVAWLLVAAVLLAVIAGMQRVWPPLLVYGFLSLTLVLGQAGFFHSKPRLLVPVLVILLPMALALGRAKLRVAVPVLVGYAGFGLWYGAYLITVWRFAI